MHARHIPHQDDLLPAAIPVEHLACTILQRERLSPRELSRCRGEVLLQLALCSPWPPGVDVPDAPSRQPDPSILEDITHAFTASG